MSSIIFIPNDTDNINSILVTISSSLSLVGCLFILCIYIYYKELREFQLKLIFIMTINDFIISIIFLIATHIKPKYFDVITNAFPFFCNFPDSLLHYFFLSSFFWEVCIAHTLIQVIKYNNDKVEDNLKRYFLFSYGLSALLIGSLFCLRNYSKIDCHHDSIFPHLLFFIPLILTWIYNIIVCVLLTKTFKKQAMNFGYSLGINGGSGSYINFNDSHSIDNYSNIIIKNTVVNNDIINNSNNNNPMGNSIINNSISNININSSQQSSKRNNSKKRIGKTPNIIWTSIFFLFSFGFIWSWSILVIILKYLSLDLKYILMISYFFIPLHGCMNAVCFGVNDRLRMNLKKSCTKYYYKFLGLFNLDKRKSYGINKNNNKNNSGGGSNNGEERSLIDYSPDEDDEDDGIYYQIPSPSLIDQHSSNFTDFSVISDNNNNSNNNNGPYNPTRSNSITELLYNNLNSLNAIRSLSNNNINNNNNGFCTIDEDESK